MQNTGFSTNKTLTVRGELLDLTQPRVMGILNVTPDSFYDGARYSTDDEILKQAGVLISEGATFLDVGGYSSRPGAEDVSESEELRRSVHAIKLIMKEFPRALISIDTFRSRVAEASIDEGAVMINDISAGLLDGDMVATVARLNVPYVAMHMKGNPRTMSSQAEYGNMLTEMALYFSERMEVLLAAGVKDVILDPGFGFAKTREQNFELLQNLDYFHILGRPILAGLSRKSMIWKTLDISPNEALHGTAALNTVALLKGASFLRVHDARAANQVITLIKKLSDADHPLSTSSIHRNTA